MSDEAKVNVEAKRIVVYCDRAGTQLPLDSTKKLRDQISQVVFAHERQCGNCDTTEAYKRGSLDFLRDIEVARYTQDRIDEKRAVNEAGKIIDE